MSKPSYSYLGIVWMLWTFRYLSTCDEEEEKEVEEEEDDDDDDDDNDDDVLWQNIRANFHGWTEVSVARVD